MEPNEQTPVGDNGLCLKACGDCDSPGMCSNRRTDLKLPCIPTLRGLADRLKFLKEGQQSLRVEKARNLIHQQEILEQIKQGRYRR